MSITAKELAKKLNLSAGGVSMALNNKPGVSTDTRRRILDAADRYGYDSRALRKSKMPPEQFILSSIKSTARSSMTRRFFHNFPRGSPTPASSPGTKLKILYLLGENDELLPQIEEIQYSDCIGIILLGTEMQKEDALLFQHLSVPFVLLDTYFETVACDYVLINNVQGAYLATSHLIKKTRKQPGYLKSSYAIGNFAERNSGFFKAVRAYGMSSSKSIVHALTPSIDALTPI